MLESNSGHGLRVQRKLVLSGLCGGVYFCPVHVHVLTLTSELEERFDDPS